MSSEHGTHEVLGEEVDRVVPRDRDGDLELAGQELLAVDGLGRVLKVGPELVEGPGLGDLGVLALHAHELLAVEPDVIVGARLGGKQVGHVLGELEEEGQRRRQASDWRPSAPQRRKFASGSSRRGALPAQR